MNVSRGSASHFSDAANALKHSAWGVRRRVKLQKGKLRTGGEPPATKGWVGKPWLWFKFPERNLPAGKETLLTLGAFGHHYLTQEILGPGRNWVGKLAFSGKLGVIYQGGLPFGNRALGSRVQGLSGGSGWNEMGFGGFKRSPGPKGTRAQTPFRLDLRVLHLKPRAYKGLGRGTLP